MAGAAPGAPSGNAGSSEVLISALREVGVVTLLSHKIAAIPHWRTTAEDVIELGTQPFVIHGEALGAGFVQRRRLRTWTCGWAVNSRYAGALMTSRLPYAIWEATLTGDELSSVTISEGRKNGRGSGLGAALHSMFLPIGTGLEGLLYRKATILCAMSEHTRSRMIEVHGLDPDRVLLLPHPPSPLFLDALNRARPNVPTRNVLTSESLKLLFVGRVDDPRKGASDMLAAIAHARAARLPVELTVVGPYSERWRQRFTSLLEAAGASLRGRVDLDELALAYLSHDALILPSRQEGFGIVVAEAFHAGLPVIATRSGGPEHTISQSGGGLLVDREPASLAASFQILLENVALRRSMAANAARYASGVLSIPAFFGRVRDLTQILIESARPLTPN